MSVVANVAVNLDARNATQNAARFKKEMDGAANSIKRTDRAAATATANIQRFGIAFRSVVGPLVAVTGAVTLLSRSLNVLGERQADAAALENGLKKLGGRSSDLIKLQAVADKLGKQTLFNQEDFDRGFALLTSFQSIAVGSYERVAKAAADVAQITKQDVNSSLLQLAKALQDPEKGLTALARSGTQFSETQKKLIKELVASGDLLKAQDFILQEIEKQYGNAAAAAGSAGYAGAVDSLQESFRDFQERLAKGVEPAVIGTAKALTDLFDIVNKIPAPVGNAALAVGGVTAAVIALRAAIVALLPVAKALLAFVIANPWFALAAGITAAAVALSGYRRESQKIAGAARTGGAAEVVAARSKLSETEANISLKERARDETSDPRIKTKINRDLVTLRKDAQELRAAINANPADIETDFVTPTPDSRNGKKDKAQKGRESQLPALQNELNLQNRLLQIVNQIGQARLDGNKATQAALEIERILEERSSKIAAINLEKIPVAEKEAKIKAATAEADQQLVSASIERQLVERNRQKQLEDIVQGYANETALIKAASPEIKKKLEFEQEIDKLKTDGIIKTEQEAAGIRAVNAELEKQQKIRDKLNAQQQMEQELFDGIANTVAGTFSSAFDAAVAGTENLGQALQGLGADLLKTIGKMLIMYAIGQALGALGGGDGVGVFSFLAKGFGFKGAKDGAYWPGGFQAFADGGMVTRPTMGLIGEGGEPEYIIPASKMRGAMNRYAAGARGSSVIPGSGEQAAGGMGGDTANAAPIDVRYTVERINSVDYVTADQFRAGMAQAAQQGATQGERRALRTLQNSAATRGRIGV